MTELFAPSKADVQQLIKASLSTHLDYFTVRLIDAAERSFRRTMRGTVFSAAVGGIALLEECPLQKVALDTLQVHEGLGTVASWWPALVARSEAGWKNAVGEAWATARFDNEARIPQDRTVFGYSELLDAIRAGAAHYESVRVR